MEEMKVQVSDWTETQKKVVVEIPADRVKPEVEKRYKSVAKKVHIKGFRPGKAPLSLIKNLYGRVIEEEVAQNLINETFKEVLESEQIKPLAQADLEEFHYTEDGGLAYTTIVEVAPEFEVTGYKGMELKAPKPDKPIEEAVQEYLDRLRAENVEYISIDESLSEGLIAVLDAFLIDPATGQIDMGNSIKGIESEIGSGDFDPNVERQLIGMKPGEKWIIEATFGEESAPVESWKGKTVKLEIHLREILKKELPELNDKFAKDLGFESLEELKQVTREKIERDREAFRREYLGRQIKQKLLETHNIPVPKKAVKSKVEEEIANLDLQLRRQGIRLPDSFLNSTESRERMEPEAEVEVKYELILDRIAQKEQITLSEEEEREIIDSLARMINVNTEDIRDKITQHPYFDKLKRYRLHSKVLDWVMENAVIVENADSESDSAAASSDEHKEESQKDFQE